MTFDQLLDLVSTTIADGDSVNAMKIARWIVEHLAEAQPRGFPFEEPDTFRFSDGSPGVAFGEDTCTANEARAFAAMLLRAADEAEAKTTEPKRTT